MIKTCWNFAKEWVLDLVFPKFCLGCGQEGSFLCASCKKGLFFKPPVCFSCGKMALIGQNSEGGTYLPGRTCLNCRPKTAIFVFLSPFAYEDSLAREMIQSLKYRCLKEISGIAARIMSDYFSKYRIVFPLEAVMVPIPLHKSRQRQRGFNQSELLARDLAEKLNISAESLLKKVRKTKPQMELSGEERKNNLAGAFTVLDPDLVKNKIIILIDDVKTTGSTLEEAAKTLKQAGAKQVWAATFAR